MMNKTTVTSKVLKSYMGAHDFATGEFKNKTVPILRKLEKSSGTVADFVELLLDSKILKSNIIFTETNEKWNPTQEPLIVFLSTRTHWKFWTEGFNDYLIRTEGTNNDQCSVLFSQKILTTTERNNLRRWLLKD